LEGTWLLSVPDPEQTLPKGKEEALKLAGCTAMKN